jgi:hypothetical protein
MSAVSELQKQGVSPDVIMGLADPNNLEHTPRKGVDPVIVVSDDVSEESQLCIDEAAKLLSAAADLSMNAHKLLTQAEEMRAKAYVMLDGLSSDPVARALLQADMGELPDGIEMESSLKQLKQKVLEAQAGKQQMGEIGAVGGSKAGGKGKRKQSIQGPEKVVASGSGNKGRRLSTGSVVSVSPPIQGKIVPDDYPDTWPLKYRPLHVGGGPDENRVYLCQYPKCTKSTSKLDPGWRHLAVEHMKSEAKCHLCNATYTHPGSMRAHLRKH